MRLYTKFLRDSVVPWCTRGVSSSTKTYPFSNVVNFPEPLSTPPTDRLLKGKGIMQLVSKSMVRPEKKDIVEVLFSRRHPQRLLPGSILSVSLQQPPYSFTGVLLAMRRRGPDSSFVLRNVVQRTGVEMQFFVNSPDVKKLAVLQRASGGGGKEGRRMRRAKLFYLRDSPDKMTTISTNFKG